MKTYLTTLLGIAVLNLAVDQSRVQAQINSSVPVDIRVPMAPAPVRADGRLHLFYELHITNLFAGDLELARVEVLTDEASGQPIVSYRDAEISDRIARPGTPVDLPDKRVIGGGSLAVIFLQITTDRDTAVPRTLHHRLFFVQKGPNVNSKERVVEGGRVAVRQDPPLVIGSPLRGEGWMAFEGLSNSSGHRRSLIAVNGQARIAQRFATDWVKFGADGQVAREDRSKNANWYGYGAELLAVADAVVVDVKDGIVENVPLAGKYAVPITLETIGGNYVTIDLGRGHFAFYAHLQPQSLRVAVGDKVHRGQVLGLLGNSGQSDAPHLHFHIADVNSPLGAEGVPFVFESFDVQGAIESVETVLSDEPWRPEPATHVDRRWLEMPLDGAVVSFSEHGQENAG